MHSLVGLDEQPQSVTKDTRDEEKIGECLVDDRSGCYIVLPVPLRPHPTPVTKGLKWDKLLVLYRLQVKNLGKRPEDSTRSLPFHVRVPVCRSGM